MSKDNFTDTLNKFDSFFRNVNGDVVITIKPRCIFTEEFIQKLKEDFCTKLMLSKFEITELSPLEKFTINILTDEETY